MTEATTAERKKPGRKPRPPVTETAEFRDAVAKVAAEAVQAALSGVQQKVADAGIVTPTTGDNNWMQTLAVTLAEIGNQGTGRRTVAPHVLKQREAARERMVDLIVKARADKRPATYQLRNKVLFGNLLIEPFWIASDHTTKPTEIDWAGVPNDAMIPVNDTAKEIFQAFLDSVGTMERVVPEERLGVTPNGLVVRNSAGTTTMQRRLNADQGGEGEAPHVGQGTEEDGLTIHHKDAPGRYKQVHVLGTIQEPAQQTISGFEGWRRFTLMST